MTIDHRPRPQRRRGPRAMVRRAVAAIASAGIALPLLVAATAPAHAEPEIRYGAPDEIAADYYGALLRHTRWAETVWDNAAGVYQAKDFNFAVVLGNAVLLTHGEYDASVTGVSEDELRSKTLATITHYAANNRIVNPAGTWGKRLFWDTTFQSYFLAAGKLMWDELDEATRTNLTTIATGQSAYTADLDFGRDPMSGSWTADWPTGKYEGDTAQEEVGVYTQALAPGLAWAPDDEDAARWSEQLGDWGRNAAGQPTADRNNPAVVAGKPIDTNTMQTIHDTYLVENHGSFGPHYQSDIWRSGGRNAIHFLLHDQPLPEILTQQPNAAELWESIKMVMSDQGEPFMPMVADREFLYGRDVIPIAFLGQVLRDPDAVRAEANLAAALEDYQAYAPVDRLTKFSGEPKYEPEARAEIAISYLLHVEAAESEQGVVEPTPQEEFFERLSGVRDFGAVPGLTVQQSENAWAAASSRRGYVKFPWVPQHDSWLFHVSGGTPFLYPSTGAVVDERSVRTFTPPRDGFEGTSSVFRIGEGYAGQVTLPTGSAIYASSGAGADDAAFSVRNLEMGGYAGLDGDRTYASAEGEVTSTQPETRPVSPADSSAARLDVHEFAPVTARYVRMQGRQGHPQYGYSMFAFHAWGEQGDPTDLAAGAPAQASSEDAGPGRTAARVTDGSPSTRWSVPTSQRQRPDSWIQVDLGEETTVAGARFAWEASVPSRYEVQTSVDGQSWTTVSTYDVAPADASVYRLDTVDLVPAGAQAPAPVSARYVRMQGERGSPEYGYSLFHLRALTADGTNVAAGKPATASSTETGRTANAVTDGSGSTRWAVAREERARADSWIQVDLGAPVDVARVQLGWESAAGQRYRVQTSLDGETWHDAATFRFTGDQVLSSEGDWLTVEDKAGFVVRGEDSPIVVSAQSPTRHLVRLADEGGDAPLLVEMLPGDAAATRTQAERPVPVPDDAALQVSTLDGFLSAFNLTADEITTTVTVPHDGEVALYQGEQVVGPDASRVEVSVPAGSALVLPPRFVLEADDLAGETTVTVADASSLTVAGPASTVPVAHVASGTVLEVVTTGADQAVAVEVEGAVAHPVPDHALSTLTFPASVLPEGMTSPALAVDGDPTTTWVPGPQGRMVTDLGAPREVGSVVLTWDGIEVPTATVAVSDDGLTFTDVATPAVPLRRSVVEIDASTRYVAVSTDWEQADAALVSLEVLHAGAPVGDDAFVDVPRGAQFRDEISWLADRGVTRGWEMADGTREFRPVTPVNRDAMAAFLYRLAGSPEFTAPETSPFTDVPTSNQFYKEIAWLAEQEITTGWDNGDGTARFEPLSSINRDAMAAFLFRFADVTDYEAPATSAFSDVPTDNLFYREISWLAENGIATGWVGGGNDGTTVFQPLGAVNRDAMAAFMYRLSTMD